MPTEESYVTQPWRTADATARLTLYAGELQSALLEMLERNANLGEFTEMTARVEASNHEPAAREMLLGNIRSAVAVRQRQADQTRREKGLLVVLETAQDLTAIRDLELVLQAIVRRARQIFASDVGYLTNFDRVRNDFYIRATDGAISERFKNVRVPPDHGICGYVLKHKTPYHSTSYLSDDGFAHDQGIDLAIKDEGVLSLLGAPLMIGNHCIGVLCICDRQVRRHAPWEVSMLATLAAQASIAIENARLFQEAQVALQRASEANQLLHRQAVEIETAADAHERMTKLVAQGCAVGDILAMIASMLDGHVALLDEAEQLIHTAADIPSRPHDGMSSLLGRIDVQDAVHKALSESRLAGGSRLAGAEGGPVLRVAALMGADRLLGAIVILKDKDMTQTQVRIFERGALVAGVVLLSQERNELAVSSEAAATIRSLVSWQQENVAALQARVQPHGIDLHAPLQMLVMSVDGRHIEYTLRRVRTSLPRGILMEECEGLIVAISASDSFTSLKTAIESTLINDARLDVVGVTSSVISRADLLPRHYGALKRGVDVLRALGRMRELVAEESLSMYSLLFEQRQAGELASFIAATAGPLIDQDRRRKSDLCATLLAYFEHAQNAKPTADALKIHVNTLRQRLETIDELLGDWRPGGRSLESHMALRMQMLRGQLTPQVGTETASALR
ncbi:hypothetical protein BH10PSE18_BH10PSE18_08900 [soil metagenome]